MQWELIEPLDEDSVYLGTDRDLGVIIEIFSGTPDDRPQPDEVSR